jgi:hypothetical protein
MAKNDSVLNPDKLTQEADLFFTCSSSIWKTDFSFCQLNKKKSFLEPYLKSYGFEDKGQGFHNKFI